MPACDVLQVTSLKFTPKKGSPQNGRLVIGGILADSGWADVDPRRSDVNIGLQLRGQSPSCCTVSTQFWQKLFPSNFGFWDQQRDICPSLSCIKLTVRRRGSAGFKVIAPGIDITDDTLTEIHVGVVIGNHCSTGVFSIANLRRRGGALVYP